MICSVSFMAFLNLTTDKAPTNPKDSTRDAFIEEMIKQIANENKKKIEEKAFLFPIPLEYFIKRYLQMNENTMMSSNPKNHSVIEPCLPKTVVPV